MKSNKGVSLIIVIMIVVMIVVGIVGCVLVINGGEKEKVIDQNKEVENLSGNNNPTNKDDEVKENYNDEYEKQRKNIQEKINEIDSKSIKGKIPSDLILGINGKNVSYDYNWSYKGFKDKYNQQNIFEEGQANYYLLYSDNDLRYKIDFKLIPSVKNSVSNVGLGVSNINMSKKSNNINKNWSIAGIHLQDDITTVLNILGNYDSFTIKEIEGESILGSICVWNNVWFGDTYANVNINFDNDFKVESVNISTIVYNTQKIDKYKSESKHVSE